MTTAKVYSYLRFSAARQAHGSSIERQAEYARKWADANGYVLDESLSMRDEGLSAYHQRHIKSGALGLFLDAVNDGKIPAGSVLIVEGLDRLSRAEPILAQAQLAQIINADITVVTASDGKQYNREKLKANPMDLVYSLLVMIRAHEESETKSKRVSAAVRRKCEAWQAGTYRGKVPSGKDPSWVRWNGTAFEIYPPVAEAVRRAIQLYVAGYGPVRILQELADTQTPITGDTRASNIDALITKQPVLFAGRRPITADGIPFMLEGYYPPLLNDDEYARLITTIESRRQKPRFAGGKSRFPSLFTGLDVAHCGHCGDAIVSQNQVRNFGGKDSVYRRFRCPSCELASGKKRNTNHRGSCGAKAIETAILAYCADQFNLDALCDGTDAATELRLERSRLLSRIAENEKKAAKFVDAAFEDSLPEGVLRRLKELETQIKVDRARVDALDAELAVMSVGVASADSGVWGSLIAGVRALDYDARIRCRGLVADTFSKIQVFFRGAFPDSPEDIVDLLLISKSGVRRMLRVDRKTGALRHGLNFDYHRI